MDKRLDLILRALARRADEAIKARKDSPLIDPQVDTLACLAVAFRTAQDVERAMSQLLSDVSNLLSIAWGAERGGKYFTTDGGGRLDRFVHPMYLEYATAEEHAEKATTMVVDLRYCDVVRRNTSWAARLGSMTVEEAEQLSGRQLRQSVMELKEKPS